jgi:hypothetical protein
MTEVKPVVPLSHLLGRCRWAHAQGVRRCFIGDGVRRCGGEQYLSSKKATRLAVGTSGLGSMASGVSWPPGRGRPRHRTPLSLSGAAVHNAECRCICRSLPSLSAATEVDGRIGVHIWGHQRRLNGNIWKARARFVNADAEFYFIDNYH